MYKKILIGTGILTLALLIIAGVMNNKADIVIFTTLEDYRMDQLTKDLKEKFPNKNIAIQYMSTGELVSRLRYEDVNTNADIVMGLEATNCETLLNEKPNIFRDLSHQYVGEYAVENYYDSDVISNIPKSSFKPGEICKYHVFDKEAGCVAINKHVLESKGLTAPTSFDDLLDPKYKGLICMPDPKYSGTGYYWVNGLVSCWGEEAAMDYFSKLDDNFIKNGYTTSGSGPLKMLEKGEAAIGLGMSFQFAKKIHDNESIDYGIEMLYFDITDTNDITYEQASPYTLFTMAVVNTKLRKEGVSDVYDYIYKDWTYMDKYMFDPEVIYNKQTDKEEYKEQKKDFDKKVFQYFGNYKFAKSYMPMKGIFDGEHKKNILNSWDKWREEKL